MKYARFCARLTGALTVFLALASGGTAARSQIQTTGRATISGLFDSNVNELPNAEASYGLNAIGSVTLRCPTVTKAAGTDYALVSAQSANTLYATRVADSRTLNQLQINYAFATARGFKIQPFLRGELKRYVKGDRNYRVAGAGITAAMTSRQNVFINVDLYRTKVWFSSYSEFNNRSDIVSLSIGKRLSGLEFFALKAIAGNHQYGKSAIDRDGLARSIRQRDNTFAYGASGEGYLWSVLIQSNYLFMIVASNSYGSSLSMHKIDLLLLRKIGPGLFIKLYGATEFRNYSEKGFIAEDITAYQVGQDNKAFILEVGKAFGDVYELKLRAHWYKNQALLKRDYYNRFLLGAGIERKL